MEDVKLVDIEGGKKEECLKAKIAEIQTNKKKEKIRFLYRDINDLNKGYQPELI
jgi:hypothetical protein